MLAKVGPPGRPKTGRKPAGPVLKHLVQLVVDVPVWGPMAQGAQPPPAQAHFCVPSCLAPSRAPVLVCVAMGVEPACAAVSSSRARRLRAAAVRRRLWMWNDLWSLPRVGRAPCRQDGVQSSSTTQVETAVSVGGTDTHQGELTALWSLDEHVVYMTRRLCVPEAIVTHSIAA